MLSASSSSHFPIAHLPCTRHLNLAGYGEQGSSSEETAQAAKATVHFELMESAWEVWAVGWLIYAVNLQAINPRQEPAHT